MPMQNKNVPVLLLLLLPLPSSIAGIEPPPSGFYTEKLTARRKRSQELLNSTLMKSAP